MPGLSDSEQTSRYGGNWGAKKVTRHIEGKGVASFFGYDKSRRALNEDVTTQSPGLQAAFAEGSVRGKRSKDSSGAGDTTKRGGVGGVA